MSENSYSLEDLRELAVEADIYVNEPTRLKTRKSRIKEVIPMLDEVAGPLYIDKPVRVFGVHGRAEFQRETSTIKQYLSPGQVKGISEGFIVVNYEQLAQQVHQDGDERQSRLISEIQERSVGALGVSHLVRRQIITANRPDYLTSVHYINRAIAPISSSFLFPEESQSALLANEERLEELIRILRVSSPESAKAFAKMQNALVNAPDPLQGLSDCAADFKSFCEAGDDNAIAAAHDYLQIVAGPKLFGSVYTFADALPPSLIQPPQGRLAILQFPPENSYSMLVTNLVIAKDLVQKNDQLCMEGGRALYALGHLYDEGVIDSSSIYIPVEQLQDINFSVLGQVR
jgi:hypothetical protein